MLKEEIWSVSPERVQAFFRAQPEVTLENGQAFHFRSCRIQITEADPSGNGFWNTKRTKLCLEGSAADVETIYRRFFLQFLSAGG